NYVYAGFGVGYRKVLAPGHQDSALEASLTYEPGYHWFQRTNKTVPGFIVPSDTYEGRVHFRLRTDMLDRNLMELAHRGFSFGGDAVYGHRTHWQNWGGVVFDAPDFRSEKYYFAASAYAVVAGRAPFVESERHRLIWSAYGGIVSGMPWNSQVELNYSYNFGIFRSSDSGPKQGGHGMFISWSKMF